MDNAASRLGRSLKDYIAPVSSAENDALNARAADPDGGGAANFDAEVERNLRRNYAAQLGHGMLAMTGFRLVNAPTFVPAYLFSLTGSDLLVGAAMASQNLGAFFSSLFGAVAIEHRERILPLAFFYGWMMRLSVLGLALTSFFAPPSIVAPVFALFLLCLGVFGGMQNVTFSVLMSKTIPQRIRGRLLGLRSFLGGLTASLVAWIGGSFLVAGNAFGNGYASTFLLAFALTALGLMVFSLVREPKSLELREPARFRQRLRQIPAMLGAEPNFARYFFVQMLAACGTIAVPFYVLTAGQHLGLSGRLLGDLSFALLISQTISNLAWGWLGDKMGFRLALILALIVWAGGAGLLIGAHSYWAVALAFAGLGAGLAGFQLASQNMVFDFGGRRDLPMRLALINATQSLVLGLAALSGGTIRLFASYEALLIIAVAVKLAAVLILWFYVTEPRRRAADEGAEV
jgi:MFS family permease